MSNDFVNARFSLAIFRLAAATLCLGSTPLHAEVIVESDVFLGGREGPAGTSNYRIPGLVIAPDGSIVAFAEGRRSGADPGQAGFPIDMVAKRSTDGGATWSSLMVLHSDSSFDYSDPRPIVDADTGTIHLLYTQWPDGCGQGCVPGGLGANSSVTFFQTSTDNGQAWSAPANINGQVKALGWRVFNTGPGAGIQLRWQTDPARNGRLVDPGHIDSGGFKGVIAYSDDGGATWQRGGPTQGPAINESEVVELTNGDLLYDGRGDSGASNRERYVSSNGGATWTYIGPGDVPVTRVDASMMRYSAVRDGHDRDRILFAAPLGSPAGSGSGRSNMGIWTSYDEGRTFINPVQLDTGHAAYSVLGRLHDGTIGLLYEATGNTQIRFLNFDLDELEGSTFAAETTHFEGFNNVVDPFRGGIGFRADWDRTGVEIRDTGGLEFPMAQIEDDNRHAHFRGGQLTRDLSQPIDLDQNATYFVSLYARQERDDDDFATDEWMDVRLLDGGSQRFAFGADSSESFFVRNQSNATNVTSDPNAFQSGTRLFLLAKIVARDGSQPGNFDQIFFSAYDNPTAIPQDESQIDWQLAGTTDGNFAGQIDRLFLGGGDEAGWSVDAIRVATAFAGAVHDNGLTGVFGDVDQDSDLDQDDIDAFLLGWRTTGEGSILDMVTRGDLNIDGITDLADAFILHEALREAGSSFPFDQLGEGPTLPEPTTIGLLAVVAATSFARRGRSQGVRSPNIAQ